MVVIRTACFRGGPRSLSDEADAAPRPLPASLRVVDDSFGHAAVEVHVFEIECEVEFEGAAHRFTFEVAARDEDEATDRAIEMLDRARVTNTRQKAS